jgi:methionyl aminopeptidase
LGIYGYGKSYNAPKINIKNKAAKNLLKTINQNFGTLVFARRYLERLGGGNNYLAGVSTEQHAQLLKQMLKNTVQVY